jgi:uncharacterized protein YacL (UPF0231 family)
MPATMEIDLFLQVDFMLVEAEAVMVEQDEAMEEIGL